MPSCVAIRAEGVRKSLGKRAVLAGLDLVIVEGESLEIRGENGSGKTTLLRCLAGLIRPDAGRIEWSGRATAGLGTCSGIGLVAHETHLHPHLTLRENLELCGRLHGLDDARHRADWWLGEAGLGRAAARLPREVSQGMRRRASIALALLHAPAILLLDEPTAGLDEPGRSWLVSILEDRGARGSTTCLVTHDASGSLPDPTRILVLRRGGLRPARDALVDESIVARFGFPVLPARAEEVAP